MKRAQSLKELRDRLNYYSVIHDADCRSNRFSEKRLNHCSCGVGHAWRRLVRDGEPGAERQETPKP